MSNIFFREGGPPGEIIGTPAAELAKEAGVDLSQDGNGRVDPVDPQGEYTILFFRVKF